MSQKKFDPTQYKNKSPYMVKLNGHQGICTVWDWNKEKGRYIRRESGLKYYAYKKVDGRSQRSRCFETLEQARQWRDTLGVVTGVAGKESPTCRMTFKELTDEFFAKKKMEIQVSTFETYESNAKHLAFFNPIKVVSISATTIDEWLRFVKSEEYLKLQHRSRVTYHHELSVLRQILEYYAEYKSDSYQLPLKKRHLKDCIVDHQKYAQSKDKGKRKFIPRADFEKFLDEMAERALMKPKNIVFSILAEFQLGTGVRVGEACAISWSDINLDEGTVYVSKTVQWSRKKGRETRISSLTKTAESRSIFLVERTLNALKRWKEISGRSDGLVFSFDGVAPIPYRSVQHHYDAAFEKLGLTWKSTHILRHSYATDFLEKTKDKAALQGQLGHRTSKQTDHYAKVTTTTVREGVRAYDQSLKGSKVVDIKDRLDRAG